MRSLKSRGGLTKGRGMSENMILTWAHTMHICAQIHVAITGSTENYYRTSNLHEEMGTICCRIERDNDDLENMRLWLKDHDPFDKDEKLLKNVATELTATEEDQINCDEAEKVGQ